MLVISRHELKEVLKECLRELMAEGLFDQLLQTNEVPQGRPSLEELLRGRTEYVLAKELIAVAKLGEICSLRPRALSRDRLEGRLQEGVHYRVRSGKEKLTTARRHEYHLKACLQYYLRRQ